MVKIWVVMLSVILTGLLFGNAERAVDKIQESRIAETAREMALDGDWIVPHYNGEVRLQKPPLTYWLTAASYKLFGVNELAVRLPSLLFAIFSSILIFSWARREINVQTAANTVLVLVTSFLGMRYFRSGEADAVLLFFISLACFSGYRLFESKDNKRAAMLFLLALGLGFLTKGPAGVAIPLLTIVIYAYTLKNMSALKALMNPWAISLFLLAAFGWYAWIVLNMPDLAQHFFGKQVDETFVSGTHKQPFYWYLAHAIEFFAPWSLLLIPASVWCYQHRPVPKLVRFALIWILVVFVLLTWTVNKQTQYALLFAPPIAILIGYYIDVATGKFYQFNRVVFWLLCAAIVGMVIIAARKHGVGSIASPYWLLMLVMPLALKKLLKSEYPSSPMLIAAVLAIFGYLFAAQHLSNDAETNDIKTLMQTAAIHPLLYQAKPGDGAISFYAKRPIKPVDASEVEQILAINTEVWIASKGQPELEHAAMSPEMTVGKWTLWKITKLP